MYLSFLCLRHAGQWSPNVGGQRGVENWWKIRLKKFCEMRRIDVNVSDSWAILNTLITAGL